jgi:GNAT superfamily N-acetyltransferase
MADWREEVERWWAGVLGLPLAAFRAGGVFPASRFDHLGVLKVPGADAPVVYGPAGSLPVLRRLQELAAGTGGLDASRLATLPGVRAARVLGPAWYGYATARSLPALTSPAVRPLSAADLELLARLHADTPPAQVTESGTDGLPAFGYLENGALLAVACLGTWRDMPTIGVLTHPRARRRGLARAVVTAAAREGLTRRPVVQYRAWRANTASLGVAARTGFTHYCDSLIIDLDR